MQQLLRALYVKLGWVKRAGLLCLRKRLDRASHGLGPWTNFARKQVSRPPEPGKELFVSSEFFACPITMILVEMMSADKKTGKF